MKSIVLRVSASLIFTLSLVPALPAESSTAYQQATVYVCPMHPEVQSSTAGKCPKCEMDLVAKAASGAESSSSAEAAEAYTCPMHPEIRANAPGKCPRCQMALVATNPAISEEFDLRLECSPKTPRPNEKVRMRFVVLNPRTGQQVKEFALMHDKFFHLFVISQDMAHFQHIHPRLESDGSFISETVLPRPGRYKVYSDFYPTEGTPQVLQHNLVTAGHSNDLFASSARLTPDARMDKMVEGVRVAPEDADRLGVDLSALSSGNVNPVKIELSVDPKEIIAGRPVTLRYNLMDARTGEPIRDLAPYLGAWGHTLILSEDQSDYVHSHPEELVPDTEDRSKMRGGPVVTFNALFPRPGAYRIWTQFLRGGAITTASFTVTASRLQ